MSKYILLKDGDSFEKKFYNKLLKKDFPNYEKFWQDFIIPLTNKPKNHHFKNNKELQKIGRSENDICIAQLHYTVFRNLIRPYEIRQTPPLNLDQFAEAIVKLCAALDVADELLGRFTSKNYYDPWSEKDSKKARSKWRSRDMSMQYLRDYRNRLLHGRIYPSIIILGTYPRYRVPKFGKETKYLDWRKITNASVGSGGKIRNDFDAPKNLLDQAWKNTLGYLEKNWKNYLIRLPSKLNQKLKI